MALWSNTDANTSAPKYTVDIISGNTGIEAYQVEPIGTWGVDTNEAQAKNVNGHAGWILRTVGSGGRSGRTTEETLVAMGSMTDDGDDDAVYPDATITIVTQPQSNVIASGDSIALSVVASVVPVGTSLSYQWYDVANDSILASNTATTLNIDDLTANASYNVVVSAAGATSVSSATAAIEVQ